MQTCLYICGVAFGVVQSYCCSVNVRILYYCGSVAAPFDKAEWLSCLCGGVAAVFAVLQPGVT